MATHIATGKAGEQLGQVYLAGLNYQILEKNWRHSRWEVDVIAVQNNVLHFIEIKTRRGKNFGMPEEKVGKKKIQNLINAAEEYLHLNPQWQRIQFDILSIILYKTAETDYMLIEDVYL